MAMYAGTGQGGMKRGSEDDPFWDNEDERAEGESGGGGCVYVQTFFAYLGTGVGGVEWRPSIAIAVGHLRRVNCGYSAGVVELSSYSKPHEMPRVQR
jgi:hypothetical protein